MTMTTGITTIMIMATHTITGTSTMMTMAITIILIRGMIMTMGTRIGTIEPIPKERVVAKMASGWFLSG